MVLAGICWTIICIWNCWILEETNLTKRLKRGGSILRRRSIGVTGPKKGRSQDSHEHVSFQENYPCVVWSQKEETKRLRLKRQSLAWKGVMIVIMRAGHQDNIREWVYVRVGIGNGLDSWSSRLLGVNHLILLRITGIDLQPAHSYIQQKAPHLGPQWSWFWIDGSTGRSCEVLAMLEWSREPDRAWSR